MYVFSKPPETRYLLYKYTYFHLACTITVINAYLSVRISLERRYYTITSKWRNKRCHLLSKKTPNTIILANLCHFLNFNYTFHKCAPNSEIPQPSFRHDKTDLVMQCQLWSPSAVTSFHFRVVYYLCYHSFFRQSFLRNSEACPFPF